MRDCLVTAYRYRTRLIGALFFEYELAENANYKNIMQTGMPILRYACLHLIDRYKDGND